MSLITISRNMGCGGVTIARLVAEGLDLELYDDLRLKEETLKMGIRPDELKNFDRKAPGFLDRILSSKPALYLDLMEAMMYEVAKRGQGVIVGHGSPALLRDFDSALHVRIYASLDSRIKHMMDQQGLSREAAEKMIHRSDMKRRGFIRYAYHVDWNDLSLYDLIINREKMSKEVAANLIMEAARSQKIKEPSIAETDTMECLSLSKKIEAALLENNFNPKSFLVDVPEKGVAHIRGYAVSEEDKSRLYGVVKSVPGISKIQYDVSVMPIFSG